MTGAKAVVVLLSVCALVSDCAKAPGKSENTDSPAAASGNTATTAPVSRGATTNARRAQQVQSGAAGSPVRPPDTGRMRATPPGVDRPCGGEHVNVIVKVEALGGVTDMMSVQVALRSVARELLAPLQSSVIAGSEQYSPAIRAFRVAARDRAAADLIVSRLRSASQVQSVERDECGVRAR